MCQRCEILKGEFETVCLSPKLRNYLGGRRSVAAELWLAGKLLSDEFHLV